jgi:general secretion pathway protein E
MGIEPFLLSSSLLAVMSQRLVRLLCKDCKEAVDPSPKEREMLRLDAAEDGVKLYRPVGCEPCKYTGYRGRIGIYELVEIDDAMRVMIHEGESEQTMVELARQKYPGIETDGRRRILSGETSVEEVLRVTSIA